MNEIIDFLKEIAPTTISLIVTSIISLSIGIYLEKFKNKLTFLKYKILFHPLATSNNNDYWGNIEVYYNGNKTNHLNFITIYLNNDSNRDFKDLYIDLWVDANSNIQSQNAYYLDSGKPILLEQEHYKGLVNVIEKNKKDLKHRQENPDYITPENLQTEISYYQKNQKYHIPVFNRNSEISLNVLVENSQTNTPKVNIDIKHTGIKLIEEEDKYVMEKRLGVTTIIYGLIVFILVTVFLGIKYPNSLFPIVTIGIVGLLNLFIGLLISKIIQFTRNYLK